jgi:hypothetical protein
VAVTTVLACAAGVATLAAVTVMVWVFADAGAVNSPVGEIFPALADQVTAVWLVPVTAAANWIFPPAAAVGLMGEIVIFVQESHGSTVTL